MSQEITTPYNHELDTLGEASGVNIDQLEQRVNDLVNKEIIGDSGKTGKISGKVSVMTELFENNFSKRELAILVGQQTLAEIQEQFNPMSRLAKLIGKK